MGAQDGGRPLRSAQRSDRLPCEGATAQQKTGSAPCLADRGCPLGVPAGPGTAAGPGKLGHWPHRRLKGISIDEWKSAQEQDVLLVDVSRMISDGWPDKKLAKKKV
ncbi:hypothetical protein NDU88_001673 [Pleurodeles waltl]|uniref:Uncharacterized protein n=1 Tax=Pleurodeles waltl TaxID=8319 RepID=A0AAV7KQ59_PLEWA|nr:hypothetical protein NDU88_001673 [Pleurodeles waltl]